MEEFKISLGLKLKSDDIQKVKQQIDNIVKDSSLKKIKIELDTQNITSQINKIKKELEQLKKININTKANNTNINKGKNKNTQLVNPEELKAYKDLMNLQKAISSKRVQISGLDSKKNSNQILTLSRQLNRLMADYNNLYNTFNRRLSIDQLDNLNRGFERTTERVSSLTAKISDAKKQLSRKITTGLENNDFTNKISKLVSDYDKLNNKSRELSSNIGKVQSTFNMMKTASTKNDIDKLISSYEKFNAVLKTTQNQVATNLRTQRTSANAADLVNNRKNLSLQIDNWLQNNTAAASTFGQRIKQLQGELKTCDSTRLKGIRSEFQAITRQAQLAGKATLTFTDQLKAQFNSMKGYFTMTMAYYEVVRGLRSMYENVLEVDKAMIDLKKVTTETDSAYADFMNEAATGSQNIGTKISDYISSTADFARLGYKMNPAQQLAEVANIYKVVGDIEDIDTATNSIISTITAFKVNANDAISVVDKFNEVSNNFAISAGGIGEALTRSASSMSVANSTLDETIALATAANTIVQDPAQVGNALKTVSMRIRGAKTELEAAGEETDGMAESTSKLRDELKSLTGVDIMLNDETFKSPFQILDELSRKWSNLSDIDSANVIELIAGKHRGNVISSLMENFDIAREALRTAENSEGSAMKEHEKWMEGLEAKTKQLSAAWQSLSETFLSTNFLKGATEGLTGFVQILDGLIKNLGVIPSLIMPITAALSFKNIGLFSTNGQNQISIFGKTFTDMSKDIKQNWGSSRGIIGKTKGVFNGIFGNLKTGITQEDVGYIRNYITQTRAGVSANQAWASTMADASSAGQKMARSVEAGRVSIESLAAGQRAATTSSILLRGGLMALNTAFSVGLTFAITAGIQKLMEFANKAKEARQEAVASTEDATSNRTSYDDQVSRYQELATQLKNNELGTEEAKTAKKELLSIQYALADSYGSEASALDLVNGKYEEQMQLLSNIQKQDVQSYLADNKAQFEKAKQELKKEQEFKFNFDIPKRSDIQNNKDLLDFINSYNENIKLYESNNGNPFKNEFLTFKVKGNVENVDEVMQDLYSDVEEYAKNHSIDESFLNSVLTGLSSAKNEIITDEIQDYQKIYDEYMLESVLGDDKLSPLYKKSIDAVKQYNEALSSGEGIEEAKANFESVREEVEANTNALEGSQEIFDNIFNQVNSIAEANERINEKLLNDDKLKSYAEDLKEMGTTAEELRNINFDDVDSQPAETALQHLIDGLGISRDQADLLINKLIELGYVEGEISNTPIELPSLNFDIEQQMESYNQLSTAFSESISGTGLSKTSMDAIKSMFSRLDDYDPSALFERTANGIHLNSQELDRLKNEYESVKKLQFQEDLERLNIQLVKAKNNLSNAKQNNDNESASKYKTEIENIQNNITYVKDLQAQYEGLTSAYNKWITAQSSGEEKDSYENIGASYESMKEIYDSGWYGSEALNSYLDLLLSSEKRTGDASKDFAKLNKNIDGLSHSIMDYWQFDENDKLVTDGLFDFLDDVNKKFGDSFAKLNDKGLYEFDFSGDRLKQIADAFGMTTEAVELFVRALSTAGMAIDLGDTSDLDTLTEKSKKATKAVKELGGKETKVNLDVTSVDEADKEIGKLQKELKEVQNGDYSPKVKAAKIEELTSKLDVVLTKKQEMEAPSFMNIDISSASSQMQSLINLFQTYQKQTYNVERLKILGADTSEIKAAESDLNDLAKIINQLPDEIKTQIGLETDTGEALKDIDSVKKAIQDKKVKLNTEVDFGDFDINSILAPINNKLSNANNKYDINANVNITGQEKIDEVKNSLSSISDKNVSVNLDVKGIESIPILLGLLNTLQDKRISVIAEIKKNSQKNVDRLIASINSLQSKIVSIIAIVNGTNSVKNLANAIRSVQSKTVNVTTNNKTINTTVNRVISAASIVANAAKKATSRALGTFNRNKPIKSGKSYVKGKIGVDKTEDALINELGNETIIDPETGTYEIVPGGPQFRKIKKGQIILNHKQTEALQKFGKVSSFGKLLFNGTAKLFGKAFANTTGGLGGRRRKKSTTTTSVAKKISSSNSKSKSKSSSTKSNSSSKSGSGSKSSSSSKSSTGTKSTKSNSSSKSSSDTKEVFDYIEILLSRLERTVERISNNVSNVYRSFSSRNSQLTKEISAVSKELRYQEKAKNVYLKKANSVGLSKTYRNKIKNGSLNIQTIKDEKLIEKINDYQTWYEKALDCNNAILELKETESSLYAQRMDITKSRFESKIGNYDQKVKNIESELSLREAKGLTGTKSEYKNLESYNRKRINLLNRERKQLQSQLDKAVNKKQITKGSEEWYSRKNEIDSITAEINSSKQSIYEYADALSKIPMEKATKKIESYTSSIELLNKQIENTTNESTLKSLYKKQIAYERKVYNANQTAYKDTKSTNNSFGRSALSYSIKSLASNTYKKNKDGTLKATKKATSADKKLIKDYNSNFKKYKKGENISTSGLSTYLSSIKKKIKSGKYTVNDDGSLNATKKANKSDKKRINEYNKTLKNYNNAYNAAINFNTGLSNVADSLLQANNATQDYISNIKSISESIAAIPASKLNEYLDATAKKLEVYEAKYNSLESASKKNSVLDKETTIAQNESAKAQSYLTQANQNVSNAWKSKAVKSARKTKANKGKKYGEKLSTSGIKKGTAEYEAVIQYNDYVDAQRSLSQDASIQQYEALVTAMENAKKKFDNILEEQESLRSTNSQMINMYETERDTAKSKGLDRSGNEIRNAYDDELKTRENDLEKLKKEINNLKKVYESNKNTMSEDDRISSWNTILEKQTEYIEAQGNIADLQDEIRQLDMNNLEDMGRDLQNQASELQSAIDYNTLRGITATADQYASLIENMQGQIDILEKQNELLAAQQSLYEYGSEKYNELEQQMQSIRDSIWDAKEKQEEWNQSILNLPIEKIDKYLKLLDSIADRNKSIADLKENSGIDLEVSDYTTQMSDAEGKIASLEEQMNYYWDYYLKALQDSNSVYDGKTADEWLAEWNNADAEINGLRSDIENLKDELRDDVYWRTFERMHDEIERVQKIISGLSDLISEDSIFDSNNKLTNYGATKIALDVKAFETARKEIQNYMNDIENLDRLYVNGQYTELEYKDKLSELQEGLLDTAQSMKGYSDSIIDMYKNMGQSELDYLFDLIDARNDALSAKKDYYDYDKTIKGKTKEITELQAQIAALEGVETAQEKAKKATLEAQLAEAQEDLDDTIQEHLFEISQESLNDLKQTLQDTFDDKWEKVGTSLDDIITLMEDANKLTIQSAFDVSDTLNKLLDYYGIIPHDAHIDTSVHYASGVKNISKNQKAWTQEKGSEIIIRKSDGAILTPLKRGDSVIPDKLTDNLFEWGNYNPDELFKNNFKVNVDDTPTHQLLSNNINNHYDSLLHVDGNVDKNALPELKVILKESYKYWEKEQKKQFNLKGIKPRF